MSEKSDNLKQMAQEKLSGVFEQLEKAKTEIDSTIGKAKSDVESKIGQVKAELCAKKEHAAMSKTKLENTVMRQKEAIGAKFVEIKEKVESKMDEKSKKRVVLKAEKAEKYAEICMDCASMAIVEAELACLEACHARSEAEELVGAGVEG